MSAGAQLFAAVCSCLCASAGERQKLASAILGRDRKLSRYRAHQEMDERENSLRVAGRDAARANPRSARVLQVEPRR